MAYGNEMKRLNPCEDGLILSLLGEFCPAPEKLLDAGCGRGDRLWALQSALPAAALYGLDRDEENAALARGACPGAEVTVGDLQALPWAKAYFDAALCECTLSLTAAPETALGELWRVLRPGGVLLLGDLCAEGGAAPAALGCGAVRGLFFRDWLEAAFRRAGFQIRQYTDCRAALLSMAAQMIFDGSFCGCVDAGAALALKEHRAGYGLWVLEKEVRV